MSKFCPEWIFSIFSAQTSKEFLSSSNSIVGISKKYASAINERYNETKFEEIVELSEKILQFLSDINAGEEATDYLHNYVHYRVKYEHGGGERKLSGMFSSAFDGTKIKEYDTDKCLKVFRATIFSIRNDAFPKASPGWVITDVEDIDWIGDVFNQEPEIF